MDTSDNAIHIDDSAAKVTIHFRRRAGEVAPCGAVDRPWTNDMRYVRCDGCRGVLGSHRPTAGSGGRQSGVR
jgi:hypothetical protein